MDSSPDLSLKLRRGSSDSRDSFYMDFAQGIDSDIEEVDTTVISRAPQQPPTPPLPVAATASGDASTSSSTAPAAARTRAPLSPLEEVMPPPPPPPPQHLPPAPPSPPQPPSPPVETEDEADDADDDADDDDDGDDDDYDDYDDEKSIPPPPLPPLPSNLSYIHGSGAHKSSVGATSSAPQDTPSPSTSPSPPITPPICRPHSKVHSTAVSPPPPPPPAHLPPIPPPLTPPSESGSSQPNSPPPLHPHDGLNNLRMQSPDSLRSRDIDTKTTSPPEVLVESVEATSIELVNGVLRGAVFQIGDDSKSTNDDSSTTITTPPSNGFSASSAVLPPELLDYLAKADDEEERHHAEELDTGEKEKVEEAEEEDESADHQTPVPAPESCSSPQIDVVGSGRGSARRSTTGSSSSGRGSNASVGFASTIPAASSSSPPISIKSPSVTRSPPKVIRASTDPKIVETPPSPNQSSTGTDSVPSASSPPASAPAATTAPPPTVQHYHDEHVIRSLHSSHHHYHLPHHLHHHPTGVPTPPPTVPATYQSHHHLDAGGGSGSGSGNGRQTPHPPPSPMSSANLFLSSETASHASSPAKSSSRLHSSTQHRVTIDESKLPLSTSSTHHQLVTIATSDPPSPGSSSQQQLTNITAHQTGHLALMYHSHQLTNYPVLPAIKRMSHRSSYLYPPMPRIKAGDALATLFSALYGKILVVMGIAFPMAEVISTYIPPSFYEVYYLYLYIGSMLFLFFMYATLLWGRPKIPLNTGSPTKSSQKHNSTSASDSMDESDTDSNSSKPMPSTIPSARRPSLLAPLGRQHHYGSFYLRMGAVAFGIGSMIYSGLEFGQYFELERDTKCHNVMMALTPATRMAFIFIQMYFIFLNNEQIKVYRYKIIARFGLMHMIGTNLAVWLNVLIQETKHEILTFYNPENRTLRISHRLGHRTHTIVDPSAHVRVPRGLKGPYQIFECRRTNILGTLVQDASPFLFPCTIEYSLICAAILYVMWRSISRPQSATQQRQETGISPMKRSPHHYSVDCARAHKGLFVGILILVLTIISLILFFVLISRPDFVSLAVTEVTICELLIYGTATIATLIGMIQIRHLQYDAYRSFELDDILLVGAQTGSFLYSIFTVIAGHFTLRRDTILVLINALASIVQTACQTMFILDASRRQAVSPEHIRKKPGREIVTFMLVVNLAMWAISTLEKSRAESHPIQLNFYGLWAWTIITHVSMPLAIFYRFHSTVCLCEIWKRAYKLKPTYM